MPPPIYKPRYLKRRDILQRAIQDAQDLLNHSIKLIDDSDAAGDQLCQELARISLELSVILQIDLGGSGHA
jgi:hypothetical protein